MGTKEKRLLYFLKKTGSDGMIIPIKKVVAAVGGDARQTERIIRQLKDRAYIRVTGRWCRLSAKGLEYVQACEKGSHELIKNDVRFSSKHDLQDSHLEGEEIEELYHVSPLAASQLKQCHFYTIGDVARAPLLRVIEGTGLSFEEVVKIINEARMRLGWHKQRV